MKKLDQSGFSVRRFLLIVVVIAIIGGVGYLVFGNSNDDSSRGENTSQTNGDSTAAAPGAPADCPVVEQTGAAIFINVEAKANYECMQISNKSTLGITNLTTQDITVTLGDRKETISGTSVGGFDGEVGSFLQPGEHKLDVSSLVPADDPVIWVIQ